mmetsp:Transcript_22043/g.63026  ORF Transcript_22043/g.63026 Transcript_22043/m.63026 type:complete len:297 (+) Transcript_22043:300-1190(+)
MSDKRVPCGRLAGGPSARQQHLRAPMLLHERLQLGAEARLHLHFGELSGGAQVRAAVGSGEPPVPCNRRNHPLHESVRHQAPDELDGLPRLAEEAEQDDPGEDHEQLRVAIFSHVVEGRCDGAGVLQLRDQVAQRAQDILVVDIARANLPCLLPADESRHQPLVLAQLWVQEVQVVLDLVEVVPELLESVHHIGSQAPGGVKVQARGHGRIALLATVQQVDRGVQDADRQVVPALSLEVGHGVQARDARHQRPLLSLVGGHLNELLFREFQLHRRQRRLAIHGLRHESASMLLDLH